MKTTNDNSPRDSMTTVNDFSTYSLVSLNSSSSSFSTMSGQLTPGRMPSVLDEKEGSRSPAILGVYSDYPSSRNWSQDLVKDYEVDEHRSALLRMPSPNSERTPRLLDVKRDVTDETQALELCSAPELTSMRPITLRVPLRSNGSSLSGSISEDSNNPATSTAGNRNEMNSLATVHTEAETSLTPAGNEEIVHKWLLLQGFMEPQVEILDNYTCLELWRLTKKDAKDLLGLRDGLRLYYRIQDAKEKYSELYVGQITTPPSGDYRRRLFPYHNRPGHPAATIQSSRPLFPMEKSIPHPSMFAPASHPSASYPSDYGRHCRCCRDTMEFSLKRDSLRQNQQELRRVEVRCARRGCGHTSIYKCSASGCARPICALHKYKSLMTGYVYCEECADDKNCLVM